MNNVLLITLFTFLISCGQIENPSPTNKTEELFTTRESCQCSRDDARVCGSDGISYINECYATCFGKAVTAQGECPQQNNQGFCTMQYQPVCGFNGIEYSNSCVAANHGVTNYEDGNCQ